MDFNTITDGIISGAKEVGGAIADGAVWLGRTIYEGGCSLAELISEVAQTVWAFFTDTVCPFFENEVWPVVKDAGEEVFAYASTPVGAVVTAAGATALVAGAASGIALAARPDELPAINPTTQQAFTPAEITKNEEDRAPAKNVAIGFGVLSVISAVVAIAGGIFGAVEGLENPFA